MPTLASMPQTTALTLPAIGTGAVMSTGPLTGQGGAELYGRQFQTWRFGHGTLCQCKNLCGLS